MALLVRIARQAELPEGGKLVKESHGRRIMLARLRGQVYATDANCFHMGGNLWEGDIEDVGGHACVVCPLHRYRIDMSSGQKVDTMLDGCVSCSSHQQQRTYKVYGDPDFICVDIPELHAQQQLPSDLYNHVVPVQPKAGAGLFGPQTTGGLGGAAGTPGRGLFGSSSSSAAGRVPAPEPLAPYAGFHSVGLVPGSGGPSTPSKEAADEPALVLSQEMPQQAQQMQQQQHFAQPPQSQIPFAQSRSDAARIALARRKAATAAIAARAYKPPSAPARGLFNGNSNATPAAAGLARQQSGGQQSLMAFGFTRNPPVSTGPEDMDM